jgi:hypothetical protein
MQSFWKDFLNAKNIFLQMSQLPHQKACNDPWCLLFWFCRVSLAEYLFVLRALFPLVADRQMYYGYCINCLYPAMGES